MRPSDADASNSYFLPKLYGPSTYLCVLQRLSLPQDSGINDFIFGLLNGRKQDKKGRVSDDCQVLDIKTSHLLPATQLSRQCPFPKHSEIMSYSCFLGTHPPGKEFPSLSFCDHTAGLPEDRES